MFSAVGIGILVAADRLTKIASFLRVKVAYFQMAQYVDVSEEHFNLQSPASLRDLLNAVSLRHPLLSPQMMATMLILVDGAPTKTNVTLNDGEEVDLIPLVDGG
jgi:hypothetical protein